MSLSEGQAIELLIEKPASGGWMIARHHGQIVLVRGAIPGERVMARVERAEKQLAYAVTREVVDASSDRREASADPLCGGALYSHIGYPRQLAIKSEVIRDAFARLGRYPIDRDIDVLASPERGYRMRARFHVQGGRAGFYREGTHQLCDAAGTGQLSPGAVEAVSSLAGLLHESVPDATIAISIAENISGSERAAHVEFSAAAQVSEPLLQTAVQRTALRGISARDPRAGGLLTAGMPFVSDSLGDVTAGRIANGVLQRGAESFFQGNRFLLPSLVNATVDAVEGDGEVLDLYAGVGLFSVALAAIGRLEVTAVEGDRSSGADLRENARPHAPRLDARVARVEEYLAARRSRPPAVALIDPPRTGLSKEAAALIVRLSAPRVIYVSCDPPTLARDARRLIDAGYDLASIRAFDLFPNTPHVETLAVFTRPTAASPRPARPI